RLEQVLHVHPEKYQNPERYGRRSSRFATPVGITRSASVECALPPILDLDEANGNLITGDTTRTDSPQRGTPQSDDRLSSSDLVTINVSGLRFQTFERTLARFPDTLLGCKSKRERYYMQDVNEYFFDRHRSAFESILYIYQSGGRVKRPESVSIDIFLREMRFFQMGEQLIEEFWIAEGYEKPAETVLPTNQSQRRLWELMEYPDSSLAARIVAFISIFVIVITHTPIYQLSVESKILDVVPQHHRLCRDRSVLRESHLLGQQCLPSARHSAGLQILGKTFRASVQEFCLLIFFMAIALVLFSSGMYFAEQGEPNSKFTSIPASFWFVLVCSASVSSDSSSKPEESSFLMLPVELLPSTQRSRQRFGSVFF
ncbi:K+ channel tetramerization domain protein, partial [Teladorsagia circumcincta]